MNEIISTSIQVDDFFFETDDAVGLGLRNGAPFEPEVLLALRQFIKPSTVVLDIGANIGYFTAHMSKLVGGAGVVHAFEPEPRNFALLERNRLTNKLDNVTTHHLALGNRTDIAKLYISEFNGGMHRIYESFCCEKTALEVPIRRLDSIFKPGHISVIKIDVEGFEPFVLEGAKSLIEGQQLTIISEYCPPAMLEAGVLIVQYLDNLRKWGLKVFEPSGYLLDWDFLIEDAINWDNFGRQRLLDACDGKSIPDVSAIVEQQAKNLGCSRPYIENLVFRS